MITYLNSLMCHPKREQASPLMGDALQSRFAQCLSGFDDDF